MNIEAYGKYAKCPQISLFSYTRMSRMTEDAGGAPPPSFGLSDGSGKAVILPRLSPRFHNSVSKNVYSKVTVG